MARAIRSGAGSSASAGRRRWAVGLFSLLAVSCAVTAAPLDATEGRIVAAVDAGLDRAMDLLRRTVAINSGTMNPAGVRAVGEAFREAFEELGFETTWYDGAPFDRAGHLLASRGARRSGAPRVLLIGHLDTVFESDSPFQTMTEEEGRARGPGVVDMKGGNVVLIEALAALEAAGVLDRLAVRVVLTGDEEKRGRPLDVATRPLLEGARWADVAIGFEDGDGDPRTAVIARRGSSRWRLVVSGRPAHSSQIFREGYGVGAIFEAARILDAFRTRLAGEDDLTFNPGLIVGGTEAMLDTESARGSAFGKNNVIAGTAEVTGDLRALSLEQRERAKNIMREVAAAGLAGTSARLEFIDSYPPMAPSAGNRRLLALYDQVSRDLGFGPVTAVDPRAAGAADISFAAGAVEMALDGIGLMGSGGHTVEETADLATLHQQSKRAAVLLYRLALAAE